MSLPWSLTTLEQGLIICLVGCIPSNLLHTLPFFRPCPMLLPLFRMSGFFLFFQVVASLQQKARMQEPAQPTALGFHFLIL